MTNPFPFSSNAILTAAELNQISEAVSFTPDWQTGVTLGNGTTSAHYYEVNDMIFLQVNLLLGSTSAITGDVRMGLPINAAGTFEQAANLTGFAYDASSAIYRRVMGTAFNGTAVRIRYMKQDTAAAQGLFGAALSATLPISWTTSDRLVFATSYKRN
jgi:hypothetical protein